jgi:outer membrane immunogenic protein
MKSVLIASAVVLGMTGSGFAADAIVQEEVIVEAPAVFNWTGAYIGGQVGYLWGSGDFVSDEGSADADPDGWLGGFYAGYNYQLPNNVVVGADADFAWTGADDTSTAFVLGNPVGTLETELEWEGAVRLRLGYAVERFLPYIAGGVAFGRMRGEGFAPDGASVGGASETNAGWTLGAGLEYAFTDNVIARAEYRYTDLGDFDAVVAGTDTTTDLTTNDVRFGLAWKF